jgi:hypothetical protein
LGGPPHSLCRHRGNLLDLLRTPIARRSRERALAAMGRVVQIGRDAGAPMNYVNLCLRHRIYFAGIFLGHIDVAEALLPFYSWELIDLHTSHRGSFRADHYRLLMRRRFPQLAEIPHNSELMLPGSGADGRGSRASRHLRAFSAQLLQELIRPTRHETAILPRKLLWRLPAGLLAEPTQQDEVIFLYKISLFEQRLRRANVRLDWSAI